MKKIVIFDMDGTLIDSSEDITHSINYVREKIYSLDALSQQVVIDAINAPVRNLAKIFYETEAYCEKAKAMFENHYKNQCVQNIYLYEGIKELLLSLKKRNILLGVATNAPTQFCEIMLTHLGVADCFELLIGVEDFSHAKPDPYMLNLHLQHNNYDKEVDKAWMVGDNSKDIQSASNAMISSVFVTWGFSSEGDVGNCDYSINSPSKLLNIIEENF